MYICKLNIIRKNKFELLERDTPLISKESTISIKEKLNIYNAIDLLRDNYKTVIILMYFDYLKIKYISKVMETTEEQVFKGSWNFKVPVTIDRSITSIKEVNDINKDGLGVKTISLTPFKIYIV